MRKNMQIINYQLWGKKRILNRDNRTFMDKNGY